MPIRPRIFLLSIIAMVAPSLGGCSHDLAMPGSARVVGGGEGNFGYIAEDNGSVFVCDATTKEPIAAAVVQRGDRIDVELSENEIEVAGKAIEHKKPLTSGHQYEIDFDRAQ